MLPIDYPVHPRLRGELFHFFCIQKRKFGSSPLTRGTHITEFDEETRTRFIPAYAGNSPVQADTTIYSAVHPRLRGELIWTVDIVRERSRFIPAYAGNSMFLDFAFALTAVHPRLRGELFWKSFLNSRTSGSSPLTRGTLFKFLGWMGGLRFIPAYAGNSERENVQSRGRTVHPRLRGELWRRQCLSSPNCGSSPLTRGTQRP